MSTNRTEKAYEITWLIRRLFRSMAETADGYLKDSGLTVADRAVMEFLFPDEAMSVPGIARRYKVSRQHVQVTVNALIEKGLVRSIENPRHKRSRLIRLSSLGRDCFDEIFRNEARLLERLFADIPDEWLDATHQTLGLMNTRFS
jgi:DNA-binding MarR family transcriptional regulator